MMNAAHASRSQDADSPAPLLEVRDLTNSFPVHLGFGRTGYVSAVDDVSFEVEPGTTMGVVGESGCGKSTLARLILGLVEADSGEIKIEQQAVDWRASAGRKQLRRNLLQDLQQSHGLTYIFISHDLNVVEYMSDRASVMYLGHIVETAEADQLYRRPLHPYTQALLGSSPRLDPNYRVEDDLLEGELPSALDPPSGCRFRTRCPHAMPVCGRSALQCASSMLDTGSPATCTQRSSRHRWTCAM